jgi:DNA polymerase elongation subunit (family B)
MPQYNISSETIPCSRCPAPTVLEARYNICKKREGFVPKTLRSILKRRGYFKARIPAGGDR